MTWPNPLPTCLFPRPLPQAHPHSHSRPQSHLIFFSSQFSHRPEASCPIPFHPLQVYRRTPLTASQAEACEVPRCPLWRGLRHHCPRYSVSCIFFNKCLYFFTPGRYYLKPGDWRNKWTGLPMRLFLPPPIPPPLLLPVSHPLPLSLDHRDDWSLGHISCPFSIFSAWIPLA